MRRLRVLVLLKTTALGGAERLVMNALPYLDRSRIDYRFAALDGGGPLAEACAEAGHAFETLAGGRGALPALWALRRAIVRDGIDLVHAHLPLPGALARIAARGTGARVVYTEHTTQDVYRAPSRWLNAASYGWQEVVVAVSEGVRRSAESRIGGAARRRIAVVPNGVDLARIARDAALPPDPPPPARPGAVALLVPASLQPVKGHDVLLAALAEIRGESPPALDVWLAGEGPARDALERRARALLPGVRARVGVHFLGARRDVFALMRAADCVVLPSRREGHPLALLEALAVGRAAVATAVGGVPEIVDDGRTGLLVPAGDPGALAAAIARLAEDPALRTRLGEAARREASRRFDVRSNVAELEAIYRAATGFAGVP